MKKLRPTRMVRARSLFLVFCSLAALSACGPRRIASGPERHRNYRPGPYAQPASSGGSGGSLFSENGGGILEDVRAARQGDIVVVRIDEHTDSRGTAGARLSRDGTNGPLNSLMAGLSPAILRAYPDIDPARLLALASRSNFTGDNSTSRSGALAGTIAVRIVRDMPNGDFFIEGTRIVLINEEEFHLYISGVVRRADIAPDNTVSSSRIADAQVEFTGSGDLADHTRPGWLSRALNSVNPF